MQISDLADWVRGLDEPSVAPLLAGLQHLLDSFAEIGLGYLSLDRPSGTLSGGEAQRTKMIRHLGSSLTDVTYVFDEPTIGLHPHDIERMNDLLLQLRDKGNTVLVVEHKPETIAIADHVVDLGPGAGTAGGTVCFEGTVEGLRASDTITGRHLDDRATLKESVRTPSGALEVRGASTHNLQDVDVDIPLGVLCVVTGVAGSGKSSLIHGSVAGRDGVVVIDQGAIRGSRRSNPATYTGLLDPIRKAFAKANGVKPALFSSNSEGACPTCNGAGVIYTDLGVMATVESTCEECEGKRFQASVLEYTLGGRNISRGAGDVGDRGRGVLRRRRGAARRPRTRSSTGSPTSGSATSASASRSPRCPAASGSGSSWPPRWPRRATSTSSTSRPPACTSPTSSSCSACSTGSSTPASRSSSSSTTRRSWRTPTGSSTSAPAPATTAAGSSSRARPPTSSPPAPPSPASTSRPTSAPDQRRSRTRKSARKGDHPHATLAGTRRVRQRRRDAGRAAREEAPVKHDFDNTTVVAIDPGPPGVVTSAIDVGGVDGGTVEDVDVELDIDHSWDGDLTISLLNPSGQRVVLADRRGGREDHFRGTSFDSDAPTSILNAVPPFSGVFRPQGDLADFRNRPANGRWTLEVRDHAAQDGGSAQALAALDHDQRAGRQQLHDRRALPRRPHDGAARRVRRCRGALVRDHHGDLPDIVVAGSDGRRRADRRRGHRHRRARASILGQAGPTRLRPGSFLPASGVMSFDSADLARMESDGSLVRVIIHEMGHVLGFGTIWDELGLRQGTGRHESDVHGRRRDARVRDAARRARPLGRAGRERGRRRARATPTGARPSSATS